MLPELINDERNDCLGRKELHYCIDSNYCEMVRKNNMMFTKSSFCVY